MQGIHKRKWRCGNSSPAYKGGSLLAAFLMKKTLHYLLCLLLIGAFALVSCGRSEESASEPVIQINPLAEAVSNDETVARLYYGFGDHRLLAGENRRIKVPVNESIETSVLNELIAEGPSPTSVNLTRLINPDTTVVAAGAEGQYLAVTFSREFLEPPSQPAESSLPEYTRRFLAVYAVVNTLIEQGIYSRVRILIDEDGTGTGRPITMEEAGLNGSGEAEPFSRNGEIELTAVNTMREFLRAVEQRDWDFVYEFIAYRNQYGQDKPSLEEFRNETERAGFALSAGEVLEDVLGADGSSEIVMISYDLRLRDGETQNFINVPRRLVLENDIWKITYDAFETMFFG